MTQVDFNVIVAITSIGIWSKIIQTHFLLTQDLIITSSFIHSCSENAFLQCILSVGFIILFSSRPVQLELDSEAALSCFHYIFIKSILKYIQIY